MSSAAVPTHHGSRGCVAVAPINFDDETCETASGDDDAAAICRQIDEARAAKDFATSDKLRDQLIEAGYDVQIGRDGTTAERKLA